MPLSKNNSDPGFYEMWKRNTRDFLSGLSNGLSNLFVSQEEKLYKQAAEKAASRVMDSALKVGSLAHSITEQGWPSHKDCDRLSKLKDGFQREAELDRTIQSVASKQGLAPPSTLTAKDLEKVYLGKTVEKAQQKCEQALTI